MRFLSAPHRAFRPTFTAAFFVTAACFATGAAFTEEGFLSNAKLTSDARTDRAIVAASNDAPDRVRALFAVPAPGGFSESEETAVSGLPTLGKWMATRDHRPADWLNAVLFGPSLREPINVVFLDAVAQSDLEAENRLLVAMHLAGFPPRFGHSDGYFALLGGVAHRMLPRAKRTAFSDAPFEFANNHGRIFGPYRDDAGFWFSGAFSRERVDPIGKVKHEYVSFNQARDRLAEQLDRRTFYKRANFVDMKNHLLGRADLTTGDHDGLAVLLIAR